MTKTAIRAGLVLAALILYPGFPSATDRETVIYFTKNTSPTAYPGAECIGIIATETIYANPSDKVRWKVKSGHGASMSADACTDGAMSMDKTNVQLVFKDGVVGVMTLTSDAGGNIVGTVAKPNTEGPHKYHVRYKGHDAGPDPEIDVDCGGNCGPPPGGPGPGPGQ